MGSIMDGHPPPSSPTGADPNKQTQSAPSYLTLGDGDFSYSLDLCRFLASSTHTDAMSSTSVAAHVTCSGIDSSDEVRAKYRDADSIIRKIASLDERQVATRREKKRRKLMKNLKRKRDDDNEQAGGGDGDGDVKGDLHAEVEPSPLSIRVEHGVNAIVMPGSTATSSDICRYQHVIFNHPHVGRESAALHRRFLPHLFHTVDQHWLAPRGLFHLTLILGQADRWNCLDAAKRHGFELLNRDAFRPPPGPASQSSLGTETYFKSRRHQSGRSFANRSSGSETLTFGRVCDKDKGDFVARHLPWQNMPNVEESKDDMLQCPHCPRSFRDERARKNHIKCSHPNGGGDASQTSVSVTPTGKTFACQHCNISSFTSAQALCDHVKAKHSGRHKDIKPEWSKAANSGHRENGGEKEDADIHAPSRETIGSCDICGKSYYSPEDEVAHLTEFVPQPVVVNSVESMAEVNKYQCSHCDKSFKDARAVQQHENFCSKRPNVLDAITKR